MRKIIGTVVETLAIALIAPTGAFASHRESPGILKDPSADNTDVYAFTAPDAPGSFAGLASVTLHDGDQILVTAEPGGGSPAPTSNPSLAFWGDPFAAMARDWFEDYDEGDSLDGDIAGISYGLSVTRSPAAELDVSADTAVLVNAEPEGGSQQPTSDPVLSAQMT
jgi:Domain of unknown function (DUF4331)